MSANVFPLIFARGTHRELGRQHGAACREQLRAFVEYLQASLKINRGELHERALRFLPLFRAHCPHLVEEVEGLAEGAGVAFAEALAVQVRGEMGPVASEPACTSFAVRADCTAEGGVLIGQTSDMPHEIEDFGYVLHLVPEGKPELLMWTFGGQLGYHGVNDARVAHFANALGGGPAWRFGLPHYPVKRMILECRTLADILDLVRRAPVCSNGNYMLCDAQQILDVELTPEGAFPLENDGRGFLAHTNHYLCSTHACQSNYDQSLPDSFQRLDTMRKLISQKLPRVSVDDMKSFLSNHEGRPTSICRHPHGGYGDNILPNTGHTVCALVAEPALGRLHVARGNPCENPFVTHTLKGR